MFFSTTMALSPIPASPTCKTSLSSCGGATADALDTPHARHPLLGFDSRRRLLKTRWHPLHTMLSHLAGMLYLSSQLGRVSGGPTASRPRPFRAHLWLHLRGIARLGRRSERPVDDKPRHGQLRRVQRARAHSVRLYTGVGVVEQKEGGTTTRADTAGPGSYACMTTSFLPLHCCRWRRALFRQLHKGEGSARIRVLKKRCSPHSCTSFTLPGRRVESRSWH